LAFCTHRLNLGKAAFEAGFEVAIATRCKKHEDFIRSQGFQVFPLQQLTRSGINPFEQVRVLLELYRIYKSYKPDVVHHVAIKPVIFGSLIAWWCNVPKVINALGGLGYLFTAVTSNSFSENDFARERCLSAASLATETKSFSEKLYLKKNLLRRIVRLVFKFIFSRPNTRLILQNRDDYQLLEDARCLDPKRVVIIRGSGVELAAFPVTPFPSEPPIVIACVSRMLWDKGIGELVEAAKILKEKKIAATILLYGTPDSENPTSIQEDHIQSWHDAGIIIWKKHCSDVAKAYADCHIAVLPSYREGLPKSLLEAASCGRPIVTTNVPGCREVVIQGENGLLVEAQNSTTLAENLIQLCENRVLRERMGKAGRERVEHFFSDKIINEATIKLYEDLSSYSHSLF